MNAIIVLLVIICLIGGVIWLLRGNKSPRQRRRARRAASDTQASTPSKPGGLDKLESNSMFWGVEIGQAGCEAAHALLGQQYTFAEAPQLPLEGCSSAMCTCQFKGLKDHRSQHRRKSGVRRVEVRFDDKDADRRARKERRRGTDWKDHTY
jgi:hypothetical protein